MLMIVIAVACGVIGWSIVASAGTLYRQKKARLEQELADAEERARQRQRAEEAEEAARQARRDAEKTRKAELRKALRRNGL